MLLAMGSRPAYTGKLQAAHKKSHGWKMSLIWKHGIDCHSRERNHWLACCSFPLCHKNEWHAGKPLYFLTLWRKKTLPSLCSASHLIFSSPDLVALCVFFMLLSKGLPIVAGAQVAALCIARATRRWEECENPSEMVSPHRSAWKKSRCMYSLIHKSGLRTFLW